MTGPAAAPAAGGGTLARFSMNQMTVRQWPMREFADGCAAAGVRAVGLWREPVAGYGLERTARLLRDAGLTVSSLCRGGFLTAEGAAGRAAALDDNRAAIDEAAALGAGVLVLVCGGLPGGGRDLDGARARVSDLLAELVPYAAGRRVRLAVEPLHPMFCSDRCVVSTMGQALDIAAAFPAGQVGVVADAYHIWWDPEVYRQLARAGAERRIAAFQVCDWITPLPEGVLNGRGMMGDGCIELRRLRRAVDAAGYDGPVEVEIFSERLWAMPGRDVLRLALDRYAAHVA